MLSLIKARESLRALVADRNGATAIEYGLIAAGIAIVIVAIIFTVGGDLKNMFSTVSSELKPKTTP